MALHLTIAGLVQGVGYRQWFAKRAASAGLTGWVRNRADGTVEAVIVGDEAAFEQLTSAAMSGPLGAKVDRIDQRSPLPGEMIGIGPGFDIRPTV